MDEIEYCENYTRIMELSEKQFYIKFEEVLQQVKNFNLNNQNNQNNQNNKDLKELAKIKQVFNLCLRRKYRIEVNKKNADLQIQVNELKNQVNELKNQIQEILWTMENVILI